MSRDKRPKLFQLNCGMFVAMMIFEALFFSGQAMGQVLCRAKTVMPVVSFNHCSINPWELVFEDEFDGDSLDSSVWEAITGVPRDPFFTKQKSWFTANNIVVEGGLLRILVKKELNMNMEFVRDWNNPIVFRDDFEYSSGEIWTREKFGYGKYEARVKVPKGKGFWPAFWMFASGPANNEIDVFEFWDNDTRNHKMTAHYNGQMCLKDYKGPEFSDNFHIFTLVWEPDRIEWYVDGVLKRKDMKYYSFLGKETGCDIMEGNIYMMNMVFPNDPMQVIFGIGVQNGDFLPDKNTAFPAFMEVDWFRYYRRKN